MAYSVIWAVFFSTKSHQTKPTLGKVGIAEKRKITKHQPKTGPHQNNHRFNFIKDSILQSSILRKAANHYLSQGFSLLKNLMILGLYQGKVAPRSNNNPPPANPAGSKKS